MVKNKNSSLITRQGVLAKEKVERKQEDRNRGRRKSLTQYTDKLRQQNSDIVALICDVQTTFQGYVTAG